MTTLTGICIVLGLIALVCGGIIAWALLSIKGKQKRPSWCLLSRDAGCFLFESGELNNWDDCVDCCWWDKYEPSRKIR
jgi:hypothetical protein